MERRTKGFDKKAIGKSGGGGKKELFYFDKL